MTNFSKHAANHNCRFLFVCRQSQTIWIHVLTRLSPISSDCWYVRCLVLSCRVHDLLHSLWHERIFSWEFLCSCSVWFLFLFLYSIETIQWANRMCRKLTQPTRERERERKKDKTRSQSLLLLKCEIKLFDLRAHKQNCLSSRIDPLWRYRAASEKKIKWNEP